MVNKMTLFSILCLFFTSFALKAQITQGELEIIKSELHKGKKELVKEKYESNFGRSCCVLAYL